MLNLFTILVFLFVLLGVLGLRAFTNRARREEMVRERLTELLTQVEEEAKSVAPVEYPDESVLMGLDDYHGHFPKLHARIVRIQKGLELLGWTKNLRLRVLVLGALSFTAAALVGRMTDYPFLIAFFGGAALFASAARSFICAQWVNGRKTSANRFRKRSTPSREFAAPACRLRPPSDLLHRTCAERSRKNFAPSTGGCAWVSP